MQPPGRDRLVILGGLKNGERQSMSQDTADEQRPATFIPLADYDEPSMPTADAFGAMLTRLRELVRRKPATPMIADDRLRRSTLEMLDEVASPPACGPLLAELDASLAEWLADESPRIASRLIVLPPGDRNHVIASWARDHGHEILSPPARERLIGAERDQLPDLSGDTLLVIPALEDWFVRHQHGLGLVRALLDALDGLDRHVLVGCNSWAWRYLQRAVQADAVLPQPIIFQAFDGARLHAWFADIARSEALGTVQFRDAESGEDIMAMGPDNEPHDVLVSLAARSRGIPWVAWRLWRRSLRRRIESPSDDDDENTSAASEPQALDDQEQAQTLWVIALEEFLLPGSDDATSLLLLQALLIHGTLSRPMLARVVPEPAATRLLPALIASGVIERRAPDLLACAPAAYPAVRASLTAAGLPVADV